MASPRARSLILDLLSTLGRGTMPVSALVAAGGLFGLAEGGVRVALARLLAAGRVERDERGRYRLGEAARPIQRQLRGWRELDREAPPWDGRWIGVHRGAASRPARRRADRALRFLGFEALAPGLHLRPANLAGGPAAARSELRALGLEEGAQVFALDDLDAASDARARHLWDVDALRAGYRASLATLAASGGRLPGLPAEQRMVESFRVGGRAIQQLALDPRLPRPILDPRERDALVAALRDYDRLGRECWAEFLARYGVPHRQAPADTRMAAGALRLATA